MKIPNTKIRLPILPLLLPVALLGTGSLKASIVFSEDFETDGEGSRYTATTAFTDGSDDYFIRTDGSTEASGIPAYSGFGGTYFWAAEDVDASDNPTGLGLLDFAGLDLTGASAFNISLDIGAGSLTTFDSNDDFVLVQYRFDAGEWNTALAFQNDGTTFNSAMYQDTDFDGIGDGIQLGFALQNISTPDIPVSGTLMDLRLDTLTNATGEAIAFDNIQVSTVAVPEPGTTALLLGTASLLMLLTRRFLRQKENESRA